MLSIIEQIGIGGIGPAGFVREAFQFIRFCPNRIHGRQHHIMVVPGSLLGIATDTAQHGFQLLHIVVQGITAFCQLVPQEYLELSLLE